MSVFEGNESIFSSNEEYLAWHEVKRTFEETEQMERLVIYYQGHADCYAYLKKIGALQRMGKTLKIGVSPMRLLPERPPNQLWWRDTK